MARPGEVITLQFGGYANWTGAHYWNFQDETIGLAETSDASSRAFRDLDSSVLYRVGETRGGAATYTPRLVFFERRGAMGGVSAAGYLYGDESRTDGNPLPSILTWDGSAKVVEQPKEGKSRFVRQLEAYDEDARDDDDDDDDDENRDFPRSDLAARRGEWGSSAFAEDDADATGAKPPEGDPLEALRARMAGHIMRETTLDDARSSRVRKKKTAEETRAAREEKARKEEEAHVRLVEASRALEAESRTWTDFSKATFHSRSAFLLDGVWSGADAFGGFGEGKAWAAESDRREDVRDVARRWAEECDRMQGFQVFAEDLCGFGGLAAATLEELRDEYPRQPAWLFSLRPPKASSHTARRAADAEAARHFLLNDALATATLAPLCDAYVPLGADAAAGSNASDALPPGFFGAEGRNAFRAAALAAAFADVAGTSWRAGGPTCLMAPPTSRDMRDVARHLSARAGGPFVAASFAVDPVLGVPEDEEDAGEKNGGKAPPRRKSLARFAGLTPGARGDRRAPGPLDPALAAGRDDEEDEEDEPTAEAYVSRGTSSYGRSVSEHGDANEKARASARRATTAASTLLASLDAALSLERYRAPRLRCVSEAPLPLPLTFPDVFAARSSRDPREQGSPREAFRFAAATARLASTPAFARILSRARDGWARAARGAAGRAALRAWGVDDDEVEEVSERVLELRRGYADEVDEDDEDDEELEQI